MSNPAPDRAGPHAGEASNTPQIDNTLSGTAAAPQRAGSVNQSTLSPIYHTFPPWCSRQHQDSDRYRGPPGPAPGVGMSWYGSLLGIPALGSTVSMFFPRYFGPGSALGAALRDVPTTHTRADRARALRDRNGGSDGRRCPRVMPTDHTYGTGADRAIARHFS